MKNLLTLFLFAFICTTIHAQVTINSATFITSTYPIGPSPASGFPITINLDWNSGLSLEDIDDISFTLPTGFTPLVAGSTDLDNSNVAVSGQTITFGTPFPGGSNLGPLYTQPTTFTIYVSYPASTTIPLTATYSFNGDGYDATNVITGTMTPTTGTGSVVSNIPMPLKMSTITLVQLPNNNIDIKWTAYNNTVLAHQELEYSTNGIDFKNIATIENNNTNQNIVNYNYVATNVKAIINYFRLKCFDNSNAVNYTSVANIANTIKEFDFTTFTNTIQNELTFGINSINNTTGDLFILDISGKIVYHTNLELLIGQNSEKINASDLANGLYFLNFVTKDKTNSITTKFIKQ